MIMMMVMMMMMMMLQLQMRKSTDHQHPEFVVESITTEGFRWPSLPSSPLSTSTPPPPSPSQPPPPSPSPSFFRRPVSRTINCGSKSEIAQVFLLKTQNLIYSRDVIVIRMIAQWHRWWQWSWWSQWQWSCNDQNCDFRWCRRWKQVSLDLLDRTLAQIR